MCVKGLNGLVACYCHASAFSSVTLSLSSQLEFLARSLEDYGYNIYIVCEVLPEEGKPFSFWKSEIQAILHNI